MTGQNYGVSPAATIGTGTEIGFYCVIDDDVEIAENCRIGNHVVIHHGTRIGSGCRIDDHAVIGKQPMKSTASVATTGAHQAPAVIGKGCLIGTSAIIYAGCDVGEQVMIADQATVREQVTIGDQTIVGRGVAIENRCSIGANCKIETNAYITAYSEVEDSVFVAPGVLTSNDNFLGRTEERFKKMKGATLKRGSRLGVGSVILPGKEVGAEAVVAAGAVLTSDAPEGLILAGIPARTLRSVPEEQRLDR